jgi:hypothetical protein
MKRLEKLLSGALIQQTQTLYNNLRQILTTDLKDLPELMRKGYQRSHRTGALFGLLGMTGTTPSEADMLAVRNRQKTATNTLETLAKDAGLRLEITNKAVQGAVENQANVAAKILQENIEKPGAVARAAGYAVRWGVNRGVADAAEHSVATIDDELTELLKMWIRLASRNEHREHHDALIGVTIPYSQKFVLRSPNGVYLIDRPYDSKLPLLERIGCGHGIRVSPPKGATVQPWTGGEKIEGITGQGEEPDSSGKISKSKAFRKAQKIFAKYKVATTRNFQETSGRLSARDAQIGVASFVQGSGRAEPVVYLNAGHPYWKNIEGYAKAQYKLSYWSTDNPYHAIHHEIGHYRIASENASRLSFWRSPLPSEMQAETKGKVSRRSQESVGEYLAEVYAGKVLGKNYDSLVLKWYREFGGIEP